MWVGKQLTIRVGGGGQEKGIITANTATQLTVGQAWHNAPAQGDTYEIQSGAFDQGGSFILGNAAVALLSTDDGHSFQFLKFLDAGAFSATTVDYPAVATGPGRNAKEKSVWLAWRGSNNQITATGAPVTGKGQVGTFINNESVPGSTGMAAPRAAVGPNGQVMVVFTGVAAQGATTVPIIESVDDDGLGANGFRANPVPVTSTHVLQGSNGPGTFINAQPNRGITPQVNLAWDRSGTYNSGPAGRVYMVYTDYPPLSRGPGDLCELFRRFRCQLDRPGTA
jgi:hypothetical protein